MCLIFLTQSNTEVTGFLHELDECCLVLDVHDVRDVCLNHE